MPSRRQVRRVRPASPAQLHGWLRVVLDIDAPTAPLIDGHAAPFDYLAHSFFETAEPRDCVVWACRGGGKTFYAAVATLLDLVFKPTIEVLALGGSLEQSGRLHEHLRRLFERPALRALVEGRATGRRLRLRNGSVAEIAAQSETSVRGRRPQRVRCDEVELFDPGVWEAAQLLPRSKRCGPVAVRASIEALSTMHRPYGLMADLAETCRGAAPARRLFRWGAIDVLEHCPPARRGCAGCGLEEDCAGRARAASGHLPVGDALAMKARSSRSAWEAEMLCLRPSREDLVFPEFRREAHVFGGDPPAEGVWAAGMDFGFRAPTVILWAHLDATGVLRIVDERIVAAARLEEHIGALRDGRASAPLPWPAPAWIGADPAGHQRQEQTGVSNIAAMRRAGLVVRAARGGVLAGIERVRARLAPASGSPTLFVHERCRGLIESLERHHYDDARPGRESPLKDGTDHAADALRYLVWNAGEDARVRVRSYL